MCRSVNKVGLFQWANSICNGQFNSFDEHSLKVVSSDKADLGGSDVISDVIAAADVDVTVVQQVSIH